MNVKGITKLETQSIIDLALECEHYKRECEMYASKLAEVQALIDAREDKEFDSIEANDSFISYPNFVLVEDLCPILGIEFRGRRDRWTKAAKAKHEILKRKAEEDAQTDND